MPSIMQLLLGGSQAPAVDPFFYSVTSLLHGDGTNGAQNNTFLDSSTNNFTITRNGNTTQGSFSPFSQTGWSWYFDGTGDTLSWSGTTLSGDFTVECWVYKTAVDGSGYTNVFSSSSQNTQFAIDNTTAGSISLVASATSIIAPSGTAVTPNVWHHLAWVREGSTCRAYVDGVQQGTGTSSGSINLSLISRFQTSGYEMNGYISNARIVSGTCLYPSGTTFTPPTTPLTAISGTQLLTCQANRFLDASSNAFAITVSGDVSVQPFSPFNPTTAYSTSAVGGSGYFDGSGDYLAGGANTALALPGAFTFECWFYPNSFDQVSNIGDTIFSTLAVGSFTVGRTDSATGNLWGIAETAVAWRLTSSTLPTNRAWNHIVAVRNSGNTLSLFLNGTRIATTTLSTSFAQNGFSIGSDNGVANSFADGFFADVRLVKGTAVYDPTVSTLTVPTAPLTAIANTSLLCNFINAGIFDNAADADYETVGNAQISTSVKKYGTGSMAFDGTGDWLTIPYNQFMNFGTGDFTIEGWFYLNSFANQYYVLGGTWTTGTSDEWLIQIENNGSLRFLTTANTSFFATGLITTGQWYHFAASRNAGVIKAYINGTAFATITNTNSIGSTSKTLYIGTQNAGTWSWNGYVDDWRISKGVGRYPYNFTPPTAEFPNIGGTVTLTADPYFDYTTLLLPGNGTNGAQNNTFLDSSTNAFSITRNGNTTQGTFSPFSQTGWGNYFDGTGDYLDAGSSTAFGLGTGDFTIEMWVYPTANPANGPGTLFDLRTGVTATATASRIDSSLNLLFYNGPGNTEITVGTVALNTWTQIAFVRSSGTLKTYVNGTQTNSSTVSGDLGTTQACWIAANRTAGYNFNGYISNFRIVKGTAVYTANFTPSTTPLTAVSGTSILTCQSNRFVDNSSNAFAITRNGDVSVQAFSPFNPTAAWSAATYGGSGYFDGSGDYLTTASSSALNLSTGDWTIQGWYYPTAYSSGNNVLIYCGASAGDKIVIATLGTSGTLNYLLNGSVVISTSTSAPLNAWSFFALVKSGSTTTLYLNGTSIGTYGSAPTSSSKSLNIGSDGGGAPYVGYLADIRVLNGTANTAVPTAPLTAITNTSFLCNFTNAGIYDATSKNDLETVGNAQISTTQSKFGGSSMYFDGTGDWLASVLTENLKFGTGDFTIEGWFYNSASQQSASGIFSYLAGSTYFVMHNNTGTYPNKLTVFVDGYSAGSPIIVGGTTLSQNTWYHFAITRYSGVWRLFVNGILDAATYTNSAEPVPANSQLRIGLGNNVSGFGGYTGYIDDFRITKGIARYTSNFTPPTTAFLTL